MMALFHLPGSISKKMILADVKEKYGNYNFSWQKERSDQNQIEIKNIDTEIKEIKFIIENKEKKLENFKNKITKEDIKNTRRISEIIADINQGSNEIKKIENSNSIKKIENPYENLSEYSRKLLQNIRDVIINRYETVEYLKELKARAKIENSFSAKTELEAAIKKIELDVKECDQAFSKIPEQIK